MAEEKVELDFSKPEKPADEGSENEKKRPEGIMVVKGKDEAVDKIVTEGGIEARFFIESHGAKGAGKEEVAEALKNTILKDLRNEQDVAVREIKFHPVIQNQGMYSGFVEVDFASPELRNMVYLATRYGPAAVEIIHPDSVSLSKSDLQNMLADISAVVTGLSARVMELMSPEQRDKAIRKGVGLE